MGSACWQPQVICRQADAGRRAGGTGRVCWAAPGETQAGRCRQAGGPQASAPSTKATKNTQSQGHLQRPCTRATWPQPPGGATRERWRGSSAAGQGQDGAGCGTEVLSCLRLKCGWRAAAQVQSRDSAAETAQQQQETGISFSAHQLDSKYCKKACRQFTLLRGGRRASQQA